MANDIVTIDHIASAAIANLYETTVAAQLVHRDYSAEFVPGRGRTVSFRRPARFEAIPFDPATGVEVQDIDEDTDSITMDKHYDVSFGFGTVERTLDVTEYNERFVMPACEALSQQVDRDVILCGQAGFTTGIGNVTPNAAGEDYKGYAGGAYPWSDSRVMIEAGKVLNKRSVPMTDRNLLAGPEMAAAFEAEQTWRQADKSGSTEGLREGSFGVRKHGFQPYMTQNITTPTSPAVGAPNTEVALAFHRTAISLVTRPLVLPDGAQDARIIDYGGFGLRIVQDYDAKFKKDMISIDVLYGVKAINPERGVKIRALRAS